MAAQNPFSVSDFIAITNQVLDTAYPVVEIEGEVASFKTNQDKYVFFDLKDEDASVGCFMMLWQLRQPIEDGMKVVVTGSPKLTKWGKFSVTVRAIRPSGEGAIKKSFEILKAKLESEGLFAAERKRPIPSIPARIGLISSPEAAGYIDFITILNDRWGGVRVDVAAVPVQGVGAADKIIRAIEYFNTRNELPEVIVIVRGGGSADDLSVFNDEPLVRAIAGSRVPTMVGVGHEVDVTLADLAADVRAATPSNAAQLLVPDRRNIAAGVRSQIQGVLPHIQTALQEQKRQVNNLLGNALRSIEQRVQSAKHQATSLSAVLLQLDPRTVLARGYALVRGDIDVGNLIEIETQKSIIKAEVKDVKER